MASTFLPTSPFSNQMQALPYTYEERPRKKMKTCDTAPSSIISPSTSSHHPKQTQECWWRELDRMVFEHPDPNNGLDRKEMIGIFISLDDVHTCENAFGSHIGVSESGTGAVYINYRYRSGMVISETLNAHVGCHNRNVLYRNTGDICSTRTVVQIRRDSFGLIIGLKPFENDAAFVRIGK